MKSVLKCALLAASCLLAFFLSTTNSVAQETSDVIKINTDLVVLDALVIDKKTGRAVGGFKPEDFELYEDGVKQEISYFSRDELPLSILLLLDTSGSVRPIIEQIGEGALQALQQLKPQDEVAVMAFATFPQLVQSFTRDRRLTTEKIKEASRIDVGRGTFLNDALYKAAFEMARAANPSSRRVIIVITDNIARTGSKEEVNRTVRELSESGTVVNGLIVRAGIGKVMNVMTLGLIKAVNGYSEQTGGEIINADKKEVEEKLAETIRNLRSRYSLGFRPANTKDETFRRLKLQLLPATLKQRGGKLIIRTKPGYYFRRKN
ncbi:MAG: VWA domain-containing protein [Pyrinomonadaceae bacterium]|nr:VWA domain-containing protein [Pyrinomonadaceae bacterium]